MCTMYCSSDSQSGHRIWGVTEYTENKKTKRRSTSVAKNRALTQFTFRSFIHICQKQYSHFSLHILSVYYSNWPCHNEEKKVEKQPIKTCHTDCLSYLPVGEPLLTALLLTRNLSCRLSDNKYFCHIKLSKLLNTHRNKPPVLYGDQTFRYWWNFVTHTENPPTHTHTIVCHIKHFMSFKCHAEIKCLLTNMTQSSGLIINSLVLMPAHHCFSGWPGASLNN